MYFERKFNGDSDDAKHFILQCLVLEIWVFPRRHLFAKKARFFGKKRNLDFLNFLFFLNVFIF